MTTIPKLDCIGDDADAAVNRFRNPNHKPALTNDRKYAIGHKSLNRFYAASQFNEGEPSTDKLELARQWTAEYLNRTTWDWSLECEAVPV